MGLGFCFRFVLGGFRTVATWRRKNIFGFTPLMLTRRDEEPAGDDGPVIERILLH